jgi:hypothetical protein
MLTCAEWSTKVLSLLALLVQKVLSLLALLVQKVLSLLALLAQKVLSSLALPVQNVQILTRARGHKEGDSVYLLYQYKRTNTDARKGPQRGRLAHRFVNARDMLTYADVC